MTDLLDIQCPSCGIMITVDGDCIEVNCPQCGEYIDVGEHLGDVWWEPENDERYDE
jgi:endogenous inhibitor of DNA gyrase (YacG/DUF329 family)